MKLSRKQCAKTIARNVYERHNEEHYIYSAFITDKLVGMYELLSDNGIEMAYSMLYDIITVTFRECDKIHKYEFTIEEVR
mgnify:CR=1 FL=1|jgi:hypothetical protein